MPLIQTNRVYRRLLVAALSAASTFTSQAQFSALSNSTQIENTGVYLSPWLGTYSQTSTESPWLYTDAMGWAYLYETPNSDSLWLYNEELSGWIWTTSQNFPYAYSPALGWLYFNRVDPLSYYYSFNSANWMTLEKSWNSPVINNQEQAARFLSQATLGADYETIVNVTALGEEAWMDRQFNIPVTTLTSRINTLYVNQDGEFVPEFIDAFNIIFRTGWWEQVMKGEDLLRQRVALALSEIFVISDTGELEDFPMGIASYYDMLQRNAFGNFRNLLYDVTLHPCMGHYLSHAGNRPPDATTGRFSDENYAREIMQLFTIGLYELNMDGSRKPDTNGNPIPTYTNADITEFARVYTGMHYDVRAELNDLADDPEVTESITIDTVTFDEIMGFEMVNFIDPMYFYEREHDTGTKTLLNGTVLPTGQTIQQDLNGALDNLFNHPNTPPFISRLLIQRLVKSNPSPAYINRVANAFVDNGQGVRGDMQAILKAILLDVEARTPDMLRDIRNGKMREPFFKLVHYVRAFNATSITGTFTMWDGEYGDAFGQRPMSSPSVFNFYLPDYSPSGAVGDAGLVGPEFQIANSSTLSTSLNTMHWIIVGDEIQPYVYDPKEANEEDALPPSFFPTWSVDISDEIALANDLDALLNRLDLILTYGRLSDSTKAIIKSGLQSLSAFENVDNERLARLAIYFVMSSPDYNIAR